MTDFHRHGATCVAFRGGGSLEKHQRKDAQQGPLPTSRLFPRASEPGGPHGGSVCAVGQDCPTSGPETQGLDTLVKTPGRSSIRVFLWTGGSPECINSLHSWVPKHPSGPRSLILLWTADALDPMPGRLHVCIMYLPGIWRQSRLGHPTARPSRRQCRGTSRTCRGCGSGPEP